MRLWGMSVPPGHVSCGSAVAATCWWLDTTPQQAHNQRIFSPLPQAGIEGRSKELRCLCPNPSALGSRAMTEKVGVLEP